ncbi:MAG: DUF1841 family protein [Chloroflexota bacterium]|nr:DUF1841 family protein [Chloroflexota bacterium]
MKYDPHNPPGREEWLSLPELERTDLVLHYHRSRKIELPNEMVHATIHVTVENQIALGDDLPVESKLNQLMQEGLDRHESVHAIGTVLAELIYDTLSKDSKLDDPNAAYIEALEHLTSKSWMEKYSE